MPEGWRLVGSSVHARVAVNGDGDVYYKEFLPRGPLERLKAIVRGSRATRARHHNDLLRQAGFTAPENLAWGRLSGGREYLFSATVAGEGVTTWLRHTLTERAGEALTRRRQLLRELGDFIGRMHAAGFVHGDLRTSNVMADYSEGQFAFALIDNERNIYKTPAEGRAILRNIMQLNMLLPCDLSDRDRMRFFLQWRARMTDFSDTEARVLGLRAYDWAMDRLRAKGKLE
ncbi:hypothetical protein EY643_00330 [Halioglobus maricola]|uniref:Protein kinase domain-containing protein n=2 Tax=Halioglobus maricola TaxID=2601894 RepID=A0A5P9NQD1_9GAMM|nr:hypothetical protein EY643_00330 [Halioglobus maricola]